MLSDLVGIDEILEQTNFEGKMGSPLKPFEQLLGCMPPSQSHHIPEPYRWLMTNPDSPIIDFYPKSFTIDMNGKRWPWEAVALLPFIDSKRLLDAVKMVDSSLLAAVERERNATGNTVVMMYDPEHAETIAGIGSTEGFQEITDNKAISIPFEISDWASTSNEVAVLEPRLNPGVQVPLAGYGSLRDAPIHSLWRRKLGLNVFGTRSRYKTASLEVSTCMPPLPPVESLAPKLIGTSIFFNYPYFVEAFITAVSDDKIIVRGLNEPRKWTKEESERWKLQRDGLKRRLETGEGYTGTGGLNIPEDQAVTLSARPFEGLVKTKEGKTVKKYAKFEVEIPLMLTFWNPSHPDPRLQGIASRLEKNVYEIAMSNDEEGPIIDRPPLKGRGGRGKRSTRGKLFPEKIPIPINDASSNRRAGMETAMIGRQNYSTYNQSEALFYPKPIVSTTMRRLSTIPIIENARSPFHVKNTVAPASVQKSRPRYSHPSTIIRKGGARGCVFALGMTAVTIFFNSAGATTAPSSLIGVKHPYCEIPTGKTMTRYWLATPYCPMVESESVHDILNIRGGDFEEGEHKASAVPPLEFAHGTTTISFIFQGGIVAAVDSRASLGSFVGSKTTQKVLPVNSHILGTMAGGAADCMFWIRKLKSMALLHELEEGTRMSVARASRLLSSALYQNRALGLSVGTMIMGFDEDGPPHIYYVDNTGVRIEGGLFAVGSGGTFALGILDNVDNERRHAMTEDEAINLGIKAIRHATFRDAYSGGFINVFVITKDGWKKVFTEDLAGSAKTANLKAVEDTCST